MWDFECTLDAVGSCPESQDAKDLSEIVDPGPFPNVMSPGSLSRSARNAGLIAWKTSAAGSGPLEVLGLLLDSLLIVVTAIAGKVG